MKRFIAWVLSVVLISIPVMADTTAGSESTNEALAAQIAQLDEQQLRELIDILDDLSIVSPTPKQTADPTPMPTPYTVPCTARNCTGGICSVCDGNGSCVACNGNGKCPYCKGTGKDDAGFAGIINCGACGGKATCYSCKGKGECKYCKGTGEDDSCYRCRGKGYIVVYPNPTERPDIISPKPSDIINDCGYCTNGRCSRCYGSGKCQICDGYGKIYNPSTGKRNKKCTSCYSDKCKKCGGDGKCAYCAGKG